MSGAYQNHYYHSDGNGNVTALINASQVISARYLYDPYGNLLASSGGMADANVYRFSSQEFHEKSGLYAYAMRFYEPRLGRWLNGDPLREGGGINLYQFCGGDPINRIDPWGLDFNVTTDAALALKYGMSFWIGRGVAPGDVGTNIGEMGAYLNDNGSWHMGDVFSIPDEFARLTWDSGTLQAKVTEQARQEYEMSGAVNLAYGDIFNAMAIGAVAKLATAAVDAAIARIIPKIVTTAKPVNVAPEFIDASRVTRVPTLGESALKGIDDDMLVHFTQEANRATIIENGLIHPGNGLSLFRVGDVKNLTALQVRGAIQWGGQGSLENSVAVIVSPNAATFTRGVLLLPEYITFQEKVAWTLIREVTGGK